MPWEGEKDAYKIWLSEIILQQTRVGQGQAYYEKFITAFPTIFDLASAEEKKVFKLWEGLGYYARCRNLIATAQYLVREQAGVFPTNYSSLLKLKGVGPYTAAAIASFAYNQACAVLDGNVYRVLSRVFGIKTPIDTAAGKKQFSQLAQQLLARKGPAAYNQAIMNFGATVCKPQAPLCETCPFKKNCQAYLLKTTNALPVKEKNQKQTNRYFYFFVIEKNGKIAIRERTGNDIWKHLYEFPNLEAPLLGDRAPILKMASKRGWLRIENGEPSFSRIFIQKLSHQTVHAIFIKTPATENIISLKEYEWAGKSSFSKTPFPKLIQQYLKENDIFSA